MQLSSLILFAYYLVVAEGFFQVVPKSAKTYKSPLAQKAVEVYGDKYPFNQAPKKKSFLDQYTSLGVPAVDVDGTKYRTAGKGTGIRLTDISEERAADTFNELAKSYGDDRALQMVKTFPICLAFDKKQFAGTYKEWSGIFGEEETKDMVLRNPGLLAVRASEAAKASDQTMVFSYIVAATRPIGVFGPITLMLLVCVPFIEAATGIPIRTPFLAALTGSTPQEVAQTLSSISNLP